MAPEGEVYQLMDRALEDACFEEVSKCINIGLLCVQEDPTKRPNMEAVRVMLDGYGTIEDRRIPTLR